eukprot:evm.model.NODE_160_length_15259_cov_62.494987.3
MDDGPHALLLLTYHFPPLSFLPSLLSPSVPTSEVEVEVEVEEEEEDEEEARRELQLIKIPSMNAAKTGPKASMATTTTTKVID